MHLMSAYTHLYMSMHEYICIFVSVHGSLMRRVYVTSQQPPPVRHD